MLLDILAIICDSLYEGHGCMGNTSRAMFENLNDGLFRSTNAPVGQVLRDANMSKSDETDIVLVGGSSRIPRVQQLLQDFFNGKQPRRGVDPDKAVAYGAAVQAAIIGGVGSEVTKDILLVGVSRVPGCSWWRRRCWDGRNRLEHVRGWRTPPTGGGGCSRGGPRVEEVDWINKK
jgi:hypothetical protein